MTEEPSPPRTITCRDCAQTVSINAQLCLHCGAPGPASVDTSTTATPGHQPPRGFQYAVVAIGTVIALALTAAAAAVWLRPTNTAPIPAAVAPTSQPTTAARQPSPQPIKTAQTSVDCEQILTQILFWRRGGGDVPFTLRGNPYTNATLQARVDTLVGYGTPYSPGVDGVIMFCDSSGYVGLERMRELRYMLDHVATSCQQPSITPGITLLMCLQEEYRNQATS
jgi:hypothetical protein